MSKTVLEAGFSLGARQPVMVALKPNRSRDRYIIENVCTNTPLRVGHSGVPIWRARSYRAEGYQLQPRVRWIRGDPWSIGKRQNHAAWTSGRAGPAEQRQHLSRWTQARVSDRGCPRPASSGNYRFRLSVLSADSDPHRSGKRTSAAGAS